MATYEDSGVNISLGDESSRIAYEAAKRTFASRAGMIGEPVINDGGFSGALDMGDFYLLQNDDGVGTKIEIAQRVGKYDTLGYDLIAMVADDAICMGAETISVTNTIDVDKVDPAKISQMMVGLEKAATEQHIVIPGGEIAELGSMVNGYLWNATAVGIVEKHKVITGANIQPGDKIIGLASAGIRSNGFSLVRHILKNQFGENWHNEKFDDHQTWGMAALTPSIIYSHTLLKMHGRYKQPAKVELKGLVHVTGGGIPGNIVRILKQKKLGANLHSLPEPHLIMRRLMEMGSVSREEAYKTWNMGVGMIVISNQVDEVLEFCREDGIKGQVIGEVTASPEIIF